MSGKFLLDTNIIIGLFANDQSIIAKLMDNTQVYIPTIVLGELFYGALGSTRIKENVEKIMELSKKALILNSDIETSLLYGEIKNKLKIKGIPIPENDVWIAALAIQHKMKLVSRDKHFIKVDKIQLINW